MQQPPNDYETIISTDILDLRITGEHSVPNWIHEPQSDAILFTVTFPLESGSVADDGEATRDE
jgi:hypothetical protein